MDRERVVVTHLQVRHFKEIVSRVPKVCGEIHSTVEHVDLIALQAKHAVDRSEA